MARWPSPKNRSSSKVRIFQIHKDRRQSRGACGRAVPVQGGVANSQVSVQRTGPVSGAFHSCGRIHGPLGYQGLESSPDPWAR